MSKISAEHVTFVKEIYKNPKTTIMNASLQSTVFSQFEEISPSLRAFSLALTQSEADANDLYQDTVYKVISNAEKFRQGTNFKAWAVTIMRNLFINNYRKKMRRNTLLDQTPNNYFIDSNQINNPNEGETDATYQELLKMVGQLPDDLRIPFWMAYQGYKYEEISQKLGSPLGTIKSRIFFARRKLQSLYASANARAGGEMPEGIFED